MSSCVGGYPWYICSAESRPHKRWRLQLAFFSFGRLHLFFPKLWRAMGVALFLGCLLTALGPVSVVFLLVVAPHANLVVLTILRYRLARRRAPAARQQPVTGGRPLPCACAAPSSGCARCAQCRWCGSHFLLCTRACLCPSCSPSAPRYRAPPPSRAPGSVLPAPACACARMLTTRTGHAQEIFRYGYYVVCKAAERRLGMSAGIAALAQRTRWRELAR